MRRFKFSSIVLIGILYAQSTSLDSRNRPLARCQPAIRKSALSSSNNYKNRKENQSKQMHSTVSRGQNVQNLSNSFCSASGSSTSGSKNKLPVVIEMGEHQKICDNNGNEISKQQESESKTQEVYKTPSEKNYKPNEDNEVVKNVIGKSKTTTLTGSRTNLTSNSGESSKTKYLTFPNLYEGLVCCFK